MLTASDLKQIADVFDKKFQENFDKSFDRKFDQSFDKKFKENFDKSFDKKFKENFDKSFDNKFKENFDQSFERKNKGMRKDIREILKFVKVFDRQHQHSRRRLNRIEDKMNLPPLPEEII